MLCDMGDDNKPNYHCEGCGCCMVGFRRYSKHCSKCKHCFNRKFFDKHPCRVTEGDCPVCMDSLVHSIYGCMTLECGHALHPHCYNQLLHKNQMKCPVCKKFLPVGEERRLIVDNFLKFYKFLLYDSTLLLLQQFQCDECGEQFPDLVNKFGAHFCQKCRLFAVEQVNTSLS